VSYDPFLIPLLQLYPFGFFRISIPFVTPFELSVAKIVLFTTTFAGFKERAGMSESSGLSSACHSSCGLLDMTIPD